MRCTHCGWITLQCFPLLLCWSWVPVNGLCKAHVLSAPLDLCLIPSNVCILPGHPFPTVVDAPVCHVGCDACTRTNDILYHKTSKLRTYVCVLSSRVLVPFSRTVISSNRRCVLCCVVMCCVQSFPNSSTCLVRMYISCHCHRAIGCQATCWCSQL